VTLLGLRSMMGQDAFVSSAWRIPFVIGVGLAVVGYVLRRRATTDRPLATVLKTHRSHVVSADLPAGREHRPLPHTGGQSARRQPDALRGGPRNSRGGCPL
jgi:hypothetical protein